MKRILRIINRLNIGGPTFNAAYLTKYLAPDFETLLVSGTIDDGEASSEYILQELGIQPLYIPEMQRPIRPLKDRKAYLKIKKIIQEFKPDIVHTHAAKAGALGRLAAYHARVPVILHTFHGHVFHSYFNPIVSNMFVRIERYLASISSQIIAISSSQKKELGETYRIAPTDKISIVPNGFDLQRFVTDTEQKRSAFRKKYGFSEDDLLIGIIGRLAPVKNHVLFLQSIYELNQRTSVPFKAVVIGDGELKTAIQEQAKALQLPFAEVYKEELPALVNFTSWIKEIDVANAGLDIVALSSLNEGTPVSLVEAQAAGKPIVSTDVGGVRDVVLHEKAGFIVPPNDPIAFANALKTLLENPSLRNEFGQFGHSFAFQHFSYQRLVKDMKQLYYRLLESAPKK